MHNRVSSRGCFLLEEGDVAYALLGVLMLPRDRYRLATLFLNSYMRFPPISAVALDPTVSFNDTPLTRKMPRGQAREEPTASDFLCNQSSC